jgi:hypothetical protein
VSLRTDGKSVRLIHSLGERTASGCGGVEQIAEWCYDCCSLLHVQRGSSARNMALWSTVAIAVKVLRRVVVPWKHVQLRRWGSMQSRLAQSDRGPACHGPSASSSRQAPSTARRNLRDNISGGCALDGAYLDLMLLAEMRMTNQLVRSGRTAS